MRDRARAARFGALAIVAVSALAACKEPPPPIHIPGDQKVLRLTVKLAQLGAAEVSSIGSFNMTVLHNGAVERAVALNFNASSGALSFIDEPTDLPTGGDVAVRLQAVNVAGTPLSIGGAAGPIDLDDVASDGAADLVIVVGRLDAATPLGALATPRADAGVASAGGGLLVFGGTDEAGVIAAPEWHDFTSGTSCVADGDGCALGAIPGARAHHVMLALSTGFGPSCPMRDAILLGLGEAPSGAPLADAHLFSPGALDGDGAFTPITGALRARSHGWAVALRDCAVLIGGGRDEAGNVGVVDVLRFTDAGVQIEAIAAGVLGSDARAIATRNALDEVVVVGGTTAADTASDAAHVLRLGADGLEDCQTSSVACNGAAAEFCGGVRTYAARIEDGSDFSPALVLTECGARVFRAAEEAPFSAFNALSAANPPTALEGSALASFGPGAAVLIGGADGAPIPDVVRFDLQAVAVDAAQGAFSSIGDLSSARAWHSAVSVGAAVLVVGGLDVTNAPLANIDVLVPNTK
jgi:hypothetical protein